MACDIACLDVLGVVVFYESFDFRLYCGRAWLFFAKSAKKFDEIVTAFYAGKIVIAGPYRANDITNLLVVDRIDDHGESEQIVKAESVVYDSVDKHPMRAHFTIFAVVVKNLLHDVGRSNKNATVFDIVKRRTVHGDFVRAFFHLYHG